MYKTLMSLTVMIMATVLLTAQTIQLDVEPNHSTLGFTLDIAGGMSKISGKFMDYHIYLDYVDQDLTKSSVFVEIDAASINTGIPDRDEHLRSPDFFDVEKYPSITFQSKEIKKHGDHYVAKGSFSMHGVTDEIEFPIKMTGADGNTLGFAMQTQIDRIKHGVGAEFEHSAIENFLADTVDVQIHFWTRKRKVPKEE